VGAALIQSDGWTDRRDEDNKRFSLLREKRLKHCIHIFNISYIKLAINVKGRGKSVPLQARKSLEGSRKLRFPDFVTTAQDGGTLSALRTGRLYSFPVRG